MKTFEEMWKEAKSLGADVRGLAEEFYEKYKDKITEEDMQTIINLIAEIDGWHTFLNDNKVDTDDFIADMKKVKTLLQKHSHLLDKVVIPLE
jgi:uncharacterized protein YpuA (DUF1002 family)